MYAVITITKFYYIYMIYRLNRLLLRIFEFLQILNSLFSTPRLFTKLPVGVASLCIQGIVENARSRLQIMLTVDKLVEIYVFSRKIVFHFLISLPIRKEKRFSFWRYGNEDNENSLKTDGCQQNDVYVNGNAFGNICIFFT